MQDYIRELLNRELADRNGGYYKARNAFAGYLPDEMQEVYNENGETRQQVLDSYKKARDRVLLAIEWLENV